MFALTMGTPGGWIFSRGEVDQFDCPARVLRRRAGPESVTFVKTSANFVTFRAQEAEAGGNELAVDSFHRVSNNGPRTLTGLRH